LNSLAGTGGWVVSRNDYPTSFFNRYYFNRYTRDSIRNLQRWPRAVGKLAGDATLGPGQFLFVDPKPSRDIAHWKSSSTRKLEADFHLLLMVLVASQPAISPILPSHSKQTRYLNYL
jgi:hypothetical protein